MVQIIGASSQVKIKDADRIYLLYAIILATQGDMLGDGLRHTKKNPFQIIELSGKLNLHNNDFALAVQRLYIHTVELVIPAVLIAFAFQHLVNSNLFTQQNGEQAFYHTEVCLIAEHPLGSPVKSYKLVVFIHSHIPLSVLHAKEQIFFLKT